jgi:hypothetical protein
MDMAQTLDKAIKRVVKALLKGAGIGSRLFMEQVVTTGKRNAPVLTGNLRGSGRGDGPIASGDDAVESGAGFGSGVSATYAVPVHEKHNPFFRDAIQSEQNKALPIIAKAAIAELRKVTK